VEKLASSTKSHSPPASRRGLAVFIQARCNAPMSFRRLIAWFWRARPLPPRKAPAPVGHRTAIDLEEFGRQLSTGKAEDLKKIARGRCGA
jgi:hypothetical protein